MTTYETITTALQFLAVLVVPCAVWTFIAIQNLKLKQVEIEGKLIANAERIEHSNANFKQAIKYLDEKITRVENDLHEMKKDIKEIMRFIYRHGGGDPPASIA